MLGGLNGGADDINAAGPTVGPLDASHSDVNSFRGFLYDGGAMYEMTSLLDMSGAGWIVNRASGINDAGQIVGYGTEPNGEEMGRAPV